MKDLQEDSSVTALMRDIVRYERQIGDLIDENTTLSGRLAQSERDQTAALASQTSALGTEVFALGNLVMRLATQQAQQFDQIYRLLGAVLTDHDARDGDLLDSYARAASYSDAMGRLLTGRASEKISEHKVEIDPVTPVRALRGALHFEDTLDQRGRLCAQLDEDKTAGVHSLIFPADRVTATGFRGLSIELHGGSARAVRLRMRQRGCYTNQADVNVDLETLETAHFTTAYLSGRRDVRCKRMRDGWVGIVVDTSLDLSEDPVEIEVIALDRVTAQSSHRKGSGKPAFAVRALRVLSSGGLSTPAPEDPAPQPAGPTVVHIQRPRDEAKRAEKRAAYLDSGAYRDLARFRNCHAGQRAFVIGNGPSIRAQDLTALRDEITFVTNWFVNHPEYEAIDPSYYCVSSHEMFGGWGAETPAPNPDWMAKMLARAGGAHKFFSFAFRDLLAGGGVFPQDTCDFLLFDRPKYQIDQKGSINLDLSAPMDDGYTGILTFCLPLAHFMGIREIYLVGCDCDYGLTTPDAPKAYFYDYTQHTTRTTSHDGLMRVWADDGPVFKSYEIVRDRFAQDGISIVNCTDGGRLEVFPRARLEDVMAAREAAQ